MNKSTIRRVITTLHKNGLIDRSGFNGTDCRDGNISFMLTVPVECITPKRKTKPKYKKITKDDKANN
jgi:predicted transcriptional regulator